MRAVVPSGRVVSTSTTSSSRSRARPPDAPSLESPSREDARGLTSRWPTSGARRPRRAAREGRAEPRRAQTRVVVQSRGVHEGEEGVDAAAEGGAAQARRLRGGDRRRGDNLTFRALHRVRPAHGRGRQRRGGVSNGGEESHHRRRRGARDGAQGEPKGLVQERRGRDVPGAGAVVLPRGRARAHRRRRILLFPSRRRAPTVGADAQHERLERLGVLAEVRSG
mmetsp:Transcript_13428/g.58713  ORF Transcript_13428/g.58713 Transcript_13428/m.58713 type:complete len:223 (-) Transcript_13428:2737-3405(-)